MPRERLRVILINTSITESTDFYHSNPVICSVQTEYCQFCVRGLLPSLLSRECSASMPVSGHDAQLDSELHSR